jgi:hypothetical protein
MCLTWSLTNEGDYIVFCGIRLYSDIGERLPD